MGKNIDVNLPPIGSYPSRREWEEVCWRKILKDPGLLELLVTPGERHDVVMRAAALQRIISGKSYRQIGEELWLSSQTVSGIKKALDRRSYRSYHERGKKERKKRKYNGTPLIPCKPRPRGRPVHTKYGTIYLPY